MELPKKVLHLYPSNRKQVLIKDICNQAGEATRSFTMCQQNKDDSLFLGTPVLREIKKGKTGFGT